MRTREEAEAKLQELLEQRDGRQLGVGFTPLCRVWCVKEYRHGYAVKVVAS